MTERHTLKSLDTRITALEALASDVTKIKNLVKVYAPVVVLALLSSDIIQGKWAVFLHTLFTG